MDSIDSTGRQNMHMIFNLGRGYCMHMMLSSSSACIRAFEIRVFFVVFFWMSLASVSFTDE